MLQNGVWTDYADHTSVDSVDGKVTVALRDGGEGDETGTTDGVIEDPSGPSTSNQTITVTNASGAAAPNFTFRLERCSETTGTTCTGATPVGTASGSNNASGDSAALGNGSSWFWGSPTALEYDRNYRLSVITPLPASGWGLTGRNCNPDGISTTNSGTTAIVMRLNNSTGNQRATCTFTFTIVSGTITVAQGWYPRNTAGQQRHHLRATASKARCSSPRRKAPTRWSDLCTTPMPTRRTARRPFCRRHLRRAGEELRPRAGTRSPQLVFGGSSAERATRPTRTSVPPPSASRAPRTSRCSARTRGTDANHRFINVRTTRRCRRACGLTIALVLDRSGSITPNRRRTRTR